MLTPPTQCAARWLSRIRHFGLLANGGRRENLAKVRALLQVAPRAMPETADTEVSATLVQPLFVCPECGAAMIIVEVFGRGPLIRAHPLKPQTIPAWNNTPYRKSLIGTAEILRRVRQAALKSP